MLETTFIYCAVIGGMFLVVQLALMLIGGGDGIADGVDLDIDVPGDSGANTDGGWWFFEMISLKTLAAAATFFGLTGMSARAYDANTTVSIGLATAAGLAAMYGVYWLFKQVYKLQSDGNEDINNALGLPGQVYVSIPPQRGGLGKVHLELQGRTVEYQALSDEPQKIASGEPVEVIDIINGDTVCVRRIANSTG